MKKTIVFVLLLTLLGSFALPVSAHESYMLYFSEQDSEFSLPAMLGFYFGDRILEYTDHGLALDVYADGTLGDAEESLRQVQGIKDNEGVTVDFMLVPVSELAGIGAGELSLPALPTTFSSHEAFRAFAESETATGFLEFPKKNGEKMLCIAFLELGYEQTVLKAPISSLKDLQGLRYAADGSLLMPETLTALGAVPVDMPQDCAAAFNNNTIDAAEKTLFTYQAEFLQDCAPVVLMDNHRMDVYALVMSADAWRMLTNLERTCVKLSAIDTIEYNVGLVSRQEELQLQALRDSGVTVIEAVGSWTDVAEPLVTEYTKPLESLYSVMHK